MAEMNPKVDYGWVTPETCAHSYLVPVIMKAFKRFGILKESSLLDAGCGGGHLLSVLDKFGYKNTWGFDLSVSGVALAKTLVPEKVDRLVVHDGYVSNLPAPLPRDGYSAIVSVEVLEHLGAPLAYLSNLSSWLAKDGYLVLTTPYHGYFKNLAIALLGRWDNHHTTDWEVGHVKFFSQKSLFALLNKAGFVPVAFYGAGRIPYFWKSMVVVSKKI